MNLYEQDIEIIDIDTLDNNKFTFTNTISSPLPSPLPSPFLSSPSLSSSFQSLSPSFQSSLLSTTTTNTSIESIYLSNYTTIEYKTTIEFHFISTKFKFTSSSPLLSTSNCLSHSSRLSTSIFEELFTFVPCSQSLIDYIINNYNIGFPFYMNYDVIEFILNQRLVPNPSINKSTTSISYNTKYLKLNATFFGEGFYNCSCNYIRDPYSVNYEIIGENITTSYINGENSKVLHYTVKIV